jgi:hypothetical protein
MAEPDLLGLVRLKLAKDFGSSLREPSLAIVSPHLPQLKILT